MRQALGGAAALDALKTFSARGSRTLETPAGSRRLALEWLAMLPDHFVEILSDSLPVPISIDVVSYSGLAGARAIQKIDARGLPFPETQYVDNSPEAVAARERVAVLRQARTFARLLLVLTGASTSAYPLKFSYAGTEQAEGKTYDMIDATASDGFTCRLHVDAATHLPAMLTWIEDLPSIMPPSSTSVVTTTSVVRVPSGSLPVLPPPMPSAPPPAPPASTRRGTGPKRWLFSDFKVQNGITWPRVIDEEFDGRSEEIRLGSVKINPKLDARKFDIK
jgi:hypothetical protein